MQSVHQGQWKPSVTEFEGHRMLWENTSGCLIPSPAQSRSSPSKMPRGLWSFSPLQQWRVGSLSGLLLQCLTTLLAQSSFIFSKCPIDWFFCLKDTDFSTFCSSNTTFCLLFFIPLPQSTWWRNYEAYRKSQEWLMYATFQGCLW